MRVRKELEVISKVERCRSVTGVGWSVPELPGATLERARSNTFDVPYVPGEEQYI